MYPSMGTEQKMSRWHFAALSTSLFVLAAVFFFCGLGLVAAPLTILAWGVMTISAWETTNTSSPALELAPLAQPVPELESVLVKSPE